MSVGTVITLLVLAESVALLAAVRWLINGLRSAECREWPAIMPVTSAGSVPLPRDSSRQDEAAVATS